jgi:uncharacterized protein
MPGRPQVGIVYAPGMEQVLHAIPDAFDVLEIEPQTLSPGLAGHPDAPTPSTTDLEAVLSFPHPKVVHSVGLPFGNEQRPHPAELDAVRFAADAVGSPWVSDHLSFNQSGHGFAGFLLPLPQTHEAVRHAAERIKWMAEQVARPVLFETAANYLDPTSDDMSDGAFFAAVAETADCGILLDLHNVWTNERNGRQPVDAVVAELPLDRIIEVHLANGFTRSDFWIDAHSGLTSSDLLEIAARVIAMLPNLSLVTFELGVDYLVSTDISPGQLGQHLELLRNLLPDVRSTAPQLPWGEAEPRHPEPRRRRDLRSWRDDLSLLVDGRRLQDQEWSSTYGDRGVQLYRQLVALGRRSTVVSAAPLTTRYLLMLGGANHLETVVEGFCAATCPQALPLDELRAFEAWFAKSRVGQSDVAGEILTFERALLETASDGRPRSVSFSTDPVELLGQVGAGHVPVMEDNSGPTYELTIEPPGRHDAGSDT